jgi:hypothetical protein
MVLRKMRLTLILPLVGGLVLALWAIMAPADSRAAAATRLSAGNRAALVVRFNDATVITRCITFTEPTISGYELLHRSGMTITARTNGSNALICAIGDTGCPASDCFCQAPNDYWSYWHMQATGWAYAGEGAGSYAVAGGDMQGWSWGPGEPPPALAYADVCTTTLPYKAYLPALFHPINERISQ